MMGKQELAALGREGAKLKRNLEGIRLMDKPARCHHHHRHRA